ncbi:TAXI family TRAP transporter solute-binding subunit [Chloroflexota bacterium]
MGKKIVFVLLALVLVAGFATGACAKKPEPTPPPAPPPTTAPPTTPTPTPTPTPPPPETPFEWPTVPLRMGSPSSWSSTYLTCAAWTPIMEKETGLKWRVMPESTSPNVVKWLKSGDLEFWGNMLDPAAAAIEGLYGYASRDSGPLPITVVWQLDMNFAGMCTMGDSGIKTFDDIKPGTRWPLWTGSPTNFAIYAAIRAWFDYTEEELPYIPFGDYGSASQAIGDGKADINLIPVFSGSAFELAAKPAGLHWMEFPEDEEAEARFYEWANKTWLDVVRQDCALYGMRAIFVPGGLMTLSTTDADLVYNIVKWLDDDENFALFKDKFPSCAHMTLEQFRQNLNHAYLPVHEGTVRYLKEKRSWTEADDRRNECNTRLIEWYMKEYQDTIDKADAQGIEVSPSNEAWVTMWTDHKAELNMPRIQLRSDDEIIEVLKLLP